MNCREFRKRLAEELDAQWVPDGKAAELPVELVRHARECRECARDLARVELLTRSATVTMEAPSGLADRVADSVLARARVRTRVERVRRWSVGIAAAAVLVVGSVLSTTYFLERNGTEAAVQHTVVVRFEFQAPEARTVAVVGDWNGWDPETHVMVDPEGDGTWEIEITVEPDRDYRYQFLVDGEEWVPDPTAPITVSDGFGGTNSVLDV